MPYSLRLIATFIFVLSLLNGCNPSDTSSLEHSLVLPSNRLNYEGSPTSAKDKNMLMFSDQGAWFAYSFPSDTSDYGSFSGPFLMSQENGVWSSSILSKLVIRELEGSNKIHWKHTALNSYNSHLEQTFSSNNLRLKQTLVFSSGHTAIIKSTITNTSNAPIKIETHWASNPLLAKGLFFTSIDNEIIISSENSEALGHIIFPKKTHLTYTDSTYQTIPNIIQLNPGESRELPISQSFIFPIYDWATEKQSLAQINIDAIITKRIKEKTDELTKLIEHKRDIFSDKKYAIAFKRASTLWRKCPCRHVRRCCR